jgi:hypothetical protein
MCVAVASTKARYKIDENLFRRCEIDDEGRQKQRTVVAGQSEDDLFCFEVSQANATTAGFGR